MSFSPWLPLPIPRSQLSLQLMLRAGQSFRWAHAPSPSSFSPHHSVYSLTLPDRVVQLAQPSDEEIQFRHLAPLDRDVCVKGTESWLRNYFQLGVDTKELWEGWKAQDEVFRKREQALLQGIRVLKMDVWECLFSFICSSNNNISRIMLMVNSACSSFCPEPLLTHGGNSLYPFPPPSAFTAPDTEARLRALGFGYRASFIHRTAVALCEAHPEDPVGWLEEVIREWDDEEGAREALMGFVGVGRKVADCVLLMSGGEKRKHIVPVDVHVLKIAQKLYSYSGAGKSSAKVSMTPVLYASVESTLREKWGEYAGWVQAVLFASDLPALLKSESIVKQEVKTEPSTILASVPFPPPISLSSRSTSPPAQIKSIKSEAQTLPCLSRKRAVAEKKEKVKVKVEVEVEVEGDGSLGERVKRRRRVADVKAEGSK